MTVKQKQLLLCWFDCLPISGVDEIWGPQSKAATVQLQKKLGIKADGDFGQNTAGEALDAMFAEYQLDDGEIPTVSEKETVAENSSVTGTFWDEIEYFDREEFRCKCGGKYCNGFPAEPKEAMVRIADQLRKNLGVPITIVSGIRCKQHNANVKGVATSQHMYGEAADIYAQGVSQAKVEAELDKIGGVRYHYAIAGSSNVHFDVPKGSR